MPLKRELLKYERIGQQDQYKSVRKTLADKINDATPDEIEDLKLQKKMLDQIMEYDELPDMETLASGLDVSEAHATETLLKLKEIIKTDSVR